MPKTFTVVTPNYNMGRYLEETIQSVVANLRSGDEYYIVDGGSTDGSVDILKRYDKHVSGWKSEPDDRYAHAITKGFANGSGEYQCWVNSGDVLLSGALDLARGFFDDAGVDFIFGDDLYIDEQSRIIYYSRGKARRLRDLMLFGGWTPLQDACFWRRSLYCSVGGMDPALKYAADFDLFLRFSLKGSCKYVPVIFSAFRRHEGQKSLSGGNAYAREREWCRARQLRRISSGKAGVVAAEAFYWVWVRIRARILQHMWRRTHLVGQSIRNVEARPVVGEVPNSHGPST